MSDNNVIKSFLETINMCITQQKLLKIILSNPLNSSNLVKNILIKPILLKDKLMLSFTYRYVTKDQVTNFSIAEALEVLKGEIGVNWLQTNLFSTEADYQLLSTKKGKHSLVVHKNKNKTSTPDLKHDHTKARSIELNGQLYLNKLGITNLKGELLKEGQKKFKQIHRYIELLSEELADLKDNDSINVVDFGAGKGYLTFALYDYLVQQKKINANIVGVELRENLVALGNNLAKESGFSGLQFIADDIANFKPQKLDVLIALHACDIATDLAIHKGIVSNAQLIVVAPCCHKQIRNEMEAHSDVKELMKFGLFKERQCELLTDGLRAMLLEKNGYKVKVVEFVGLEHTPKNLMLIASKTNNYSNNESKIQAIKSQFGIKKHYLETLLETSN